jgi:iron-sulfur cluster repair protein YtfE (RIC family)
VATREQIRELLERGLDYSAVGQRLGIPPGQAYLIATGRAADEGDAPPGHPPGALGASQHLANPPYENPTSSESVLDWIRAQAAADGPMQEAAGRRTAEPEPPKAEDPENPEAGEFSRDITVVLTRQHNQVRALLQQLQALPSHKTGGSADDLSARKSIVDMITIRLSQHETTEEKYLWPAVRKELEDGDDLADEALSQEQEGTQTLAELGGLAPDTDRFDECVEQLVAQCRKHVAYEETVFGLLRHALPDEQRERLGRKVEAATAKAPTRPRKRAPRKPGAAARAAAAGGASADKLRDAAGHRPAERAGRPA